MHYSVNGLTHEYFAHGDKSWGNELRLIDQATDITRNTSWHEKGYTVAKLFDEELHRKFSKNTYLLLTELWRKAGLKIKDDFNLNQYHLVAKDMEMHLAAVEKTKLLSVNQFPIPIHHLEHRISSICKTKLKVINPFDNQSIFHFRVIRPQQQDNNPLHRDVWLDDYKDCINLYIPITGSNEQSSLIISPGSHLWSEARIERTISGAVVNDVKYNVPAVTAIKDDYQLVRPNPTLNEVLIFSPYLIHGGSANFNTDQTRISIEVRLWPFD